MKLIILAVILLFLAVVMLGIKVLFVKGAKFPSGHISDSEAMRSRGIGCAAHSNKKRNININNLRRNPEINS